MLAIEESCTNDSVIREPVVIHFISLNQPHPIPKNQPNKPRQRHLPPPHLRLLRQPIQPLRPRLTIKCRCPFNLTAIHIFIMLAPKLDKNASSIRLFYKYCRTYSWLHSCLCQNKHVMAIYRWFHPRPCPLFLPSRRNRFWSARRPLPRRILGRLPSTLPNMTTGPSLLMLLLTTI